MGHYQTANPTIRTWFKTAVVREIRRVGRIKLPLLRVTWLTVTEARSVTVAAVASTTESIVRGTKPLSQQESVCLLCVVFG
jgi:hypothetical protein